MDFFFIYLHVFNIKTPRLELKGKVSQNSFDLAMNCQASQLFRGVSRSMHAYSISGSISKYPDFFCVLQRL